jgi:hypothetical protein
MDESPHLIVVMWNEGERVIHDTGVSGHWDGENFIVPFLNEMTAEEVARIVSNALRQDAADA